MSRRSKFVITRAVSFWDGERWIDEQIEGYEYDGPWALATHDTNPVWVAQNYAVGTDAASPSYNTENTATSVQTETNFRLRVIVGESAGATTANTGSWVLQFAVDGGGFTTVGAATDVSYADSTHVTDGTTGISGILTAISGVATPQASWNEQDENNAVTSRTWVDNSCEYEYSLNTNNVSAGSAITFRMLSPSTSTAITFANVPTVNVQGQVTHTGSGTPSLPLLTASGAGRRTLRSTGAQTLPLPTATGVGRRALRSTGAATLPLPTASGEGTSGTTHSGDGAASLPLPTAEGVGRRTLRSTGAVTLPLPTASGAGKKISLGTGAVALPLPTASGAARRTLRSTGTPSLPLPTAAGTGEVTGTHFGTGTPSLPLPTASGAARRTLRATGAATLPLATASGSGSVEGEQVTHPGTGSAALPVAAATGVGRRTLRGSGAVVLPFVTASGTARRTHRSTGAVVLPLLSASGVSGEAVRSTGSSTFSFWDDRPQLQMAVGDMVVYEAPDRVEMRVSMLADEDDEDLMFFNL